MYYASMVAVAVDGKLCCERQTFNFHPAQKSKAARAKGAKTKAAAPSKKDVAKVAPPKISGAVEDVPMWKVILLGDAGGLYPAMLRDQVSKSNECAQAATVVIRSLYLKMGHASPRCNKLGLMVRLIHLTRQRVVNKATGSGRGKSGSG